MANNSSIKVRYSVLLFFFLLTYAGLSTAQTQKVFTHYMVCFPSYDGSVEGYKKDILDAQKLGIDGFALNCTEWNATYKQHTDRMFQAALELGTGFKLFFSADQACCLPDSAAFNMLSGYLNHPNYFRYNGLPFVSSWSGAGSWLQGNWVNHIINPLKSKGYNIYFVPFIYTLAFEETPGYDSVLKNYNERWKGFLNGYFYFGAAGLPDYSKGSLLRSGEAYAKVFHDSSRTYMATVSPEYWGDSQKTAGRRYYEYHGGEGLAAQWKSIIEIQKPEWVELTTWNDWNEASYFSPMDDISKYFPYSNHPEVGFHKSHKGFAELCKYYIQWYKTGRQPTIDHDQLFYFYRTHSKKAKAPHDPFGPVTITYGDVNDELFITTLLKAPAVLKVTSGNSTTKIKMAKGIVNIRVPFKAGKQTFVLRRGLKKIIKAQGEDIADSIKAYNYDLYSGVASN
jgi:glucan endo-1,3-alpha-glucosidase